MDSTHNPKAHSTRLPPELEFGEKRANLGYLIICRLRKNFKLTGGENGARIVAQKLELGEEPRDKVDGAGAEVLDEVVVEGAFAAEIARIQDAFEEKGAFREEQLPVDHSSREDVEDEAVAHVRHQHGLVFLFH